MLDFMTWVLLSERNEVDGKPFATSLEALKYIYDNHPAPENLVVTFQGVDKVGINPTPDYSTTPIGIYFYTAEYVLRVGGEVEWAGEMPFMFVCELTSPDKIVHIYQKRDVGQDLWNMGFRFADMDTTAGYMQKLSKWNKYFRDRGISGFIDHGTATIHPAEPSQGVVFKASEMRVLHRLENTERTYKDLPKYDRMGNYVKGTLRMREPWRELLRRIHNAADDAERSSIVGERGWLTWKGLAEPAQVRDYMKVLRAVAKYDRGLTAQDLSLLMQKTPLSRIVSPASVAEIFGAGRVAELFGAMRGGEVASLLKGVPDVASAARVIGGKALNNMSDADFSDCLSRLAGRMQPEDFAQAMVEGGKRLSEANVAALMRAVALAHPARSFKRMRAIVGKEREAPSSRDEGERLESRP